MEREDHEDLRRGASLCVLCGRVVQILRLIERLTDGIILTGGRRENHGSCLAAQCHRELAAKHQVSQQEVEEALRTARGFGVSLSGMLQGKIFTPR